jgi:outer membrane protein OmpA-like peptidoglycan-associated protein
MKHATSVAPAISPRSAVRLLQVVLLLGAASCRGPRTYGRIVPVIAPANAPQAIVIRGGRTISARPGLRLTKGDRIVVPTDTLASPEVVSLRSGYTLTLEQGTDLQILNPRVRLNRGRMTARTSQTRPPSPHGINVLRGKLRGETTHTLWGAEGTTFSVAAEADTVRIVVEIGNVWIARRAAPCERLVLGPGQGAVFVGDTLMRPTGIEQPVSTDAALVGLEALPESDSPGDYPYVPNLVGQTRHNAELMVAARRFDAGIVCEQITGTQPPGVVLAQDPAAGVRYPVSEEIDLVVEGQSVEVPSLLGLSLDSARATLERLRLTSGSITDSIANGPISFVLAQTPEPGRRVPPATGVNLRVSVARQDTQPPQPPLDTAATIVYFASNRDDLSMQAQAALDRIGRLLEAHPTWRVEIDGHADARGSFSYNQRLSERRARSAAGYLQRVFRVADSRIVIRGFGETQPVAPNTDPAGRQLNRRARARPIP